MDALSCYYNHIEKSQPAGGIDPEDLDNFDMEEFDDICWSVGSFKFLSEYPYGIFPKYSLDEVTNGVLKAIEGPTEENPHQYIYEIGTEKIEPPFLVIRKTGEIKPYGIISNTTMYLPCGKVHENCVNMGEDYEQFIKIVGDVHWE